MSGPPLFQRSPRLRQVAPEGQIEIPAPPQAPTRPPLPLTFIIPALIGTLISLGLPVLMGSLMPSARAYQSQYLLFSAPMMLISYLWPVVGYFQQKKAFQKAVQTRDDRYRTMLQARRTECEEAWNQQREALAQLSPAPAECLRRVRQRDLRLWERSPDDRDFLHIRLGLGSVPFGIAIKVPPADPLADPDPLYADAAALAADFADVGQVPVSLPLAEAGVTGVVGERRQVMETLRAMAIHLATHHSPDEVKLAAFFPDGETDQWAWLRWLPHTWADDGRHRYLANDPATAQRLISELHEEFGRRKLRGDEKPTGMFVVLLADLSLTGTSPLMRTLLEDGGAVGAVSIITAATDGGLPRECRAVIRCQGAAGELVRVQARPERTAFAPDAAPLELCEGFSRAMAPIRLHRLARPAKLPAAVTLLDLFGVTRVDELRVLERWQEAEPGVSLAAPVGVRGGGEPVLLDLHEKGHGPHGLVAGATGSGKSELLQTLIASLAVHYHPHDLAFILVDYKGGALAGAFADLPHLIGSITNLQGNLATRALAALKGELRRRQAVLAQAGVNHVDDYQRLYRERRVPEPLPHLVFIVDEFAELKAEQPFFMRELVSAVRVGRSLGIHLILATQKPAGVVDDQIWGNSRFRLCLRVERPEDSREVLKRPDAALLTGPGRGYMQVGSDELFELFQAGWGGAPYTPGGPVIQTDAVAEVVLDGTRYILSHLPRATASQGQQLQALAHHLADAAHAAGVRRLPGPWLAPLPEHVSLEAARADPRPGAPGAAPAGWDGRAWRPAPLWMEPAIGLVDAPHDQTQGPLRLPLGREGHLAVYGAPGTGKTTFLQTLALSLALDHSPADLHLYLLDFGGRSLSLLRDLPHVGAVVVKDDEERLSRLLAMVQKEIDVRKEAFGAAGVNTLSAYRHAAGQAIPAVVLLLDNIQALSETYSWAEDALVRISRDGGSLGIHLVFTAGGVMGVRSRISDNVLLAVALQQKDRGDYDLIIGRTGGLEPMGIPGRGLVKGLPPLEFHTALPASGETDVERAQAVRALIRAMNDAWTGPRARPVAVMPEVVTLTAAAGAVGLDAETLEPIRLNLSGGPHFLVAGPPEAGKTTFLQTIGLSLAATTPVHLYLVDYRAEGLLDLAGLPQTRACVTSEDGLREALAEIAAGLADRSPAAALFIDNWDAFRDGTGPLAMDELERIIRKERSGGFHVFLAATTEEISSAWDGPAKALKEAQTGFILGTNDPNDMQLVGLRGSYQSAGSALPPGSAWFGRRGRGRRFRTATARSGGDTVRAWIEQITQMERGEDLV